MFNVIIEHKPVFYVYFYNIRVFYKDAKAEKNQWKSATFWDFTEHCN